MLCRTTMNRFKIHHLRTSYGCLSTGLNLQSYKPKNEVVPVPDAKKQIVLDRKFIPMTRQTLIHKVLEKKYLVRTEEEDTFLKFVESLEASISHNFHGVATDLKQLYDPLNPDKETMIAQHYGAKERLSNEFILLQRISTLLEKANFQELPRDHVSSVLSEHPVYEGVLVHVDMKNYDVLRFWVLSEDEKFLESKNLIEWCRNIINVRLKKWPKNVKTYKRVVLAVRPKKQNKLMLKAFKDIPQNGLEYFVPEGKITMSKYDKSFLTTSVTIGAFSLCIKLITYLSDFNVTWTNVVGAVTGLLALNSWNAYKNKRNNYLVNLSKSLYYKSIANNRALLTLIVDRAEDEIFKSMLLAYVFIRTDNIMKASAEKPVEDLVTIEELKDTIDNWLKNSHDLELDFKPELALQQLERFGLLKVQKLGSTVKLSVPSFEDAHSIISKINPVEAIRKVSIREDQLDVEDVNPNNDLEIMDYREKERQTKLENSSLGWNHK